MLSTWNYRTFSQDKGPLFSATIPFSKIQAALPSKWRHRGKDVILFWTRLRTLRHIRVSRLAFLTPNFTNLAFFRGRWRQKIVWLLASFSSIFGFFWRQFARAIRLVSWFFKDLSESVIRECFVYFLKLYLATHTSQTQDSFNSVVVIVVNVRTCCLALIHHKLIQFISMSSSKWKSSYDIGRIYNSNGKRHFFGWNRPVIVQKMHIASYATLQLYQKAHYSSQ